MLRPIFRLGMRIMLLCLVLFGGVALTVRDAAASTGLNAAAANAEAGLGACRSSAGKPCTIAWRTCSTK